MSNKLLAACIGAMLVMPALAFAEPVVEDDFYQPFNPQSPELKFELPQPQTVEIFNSRLMSKEKVKVDPFAFQPTFGLEIYVFQVGQADSMLVVGPAPERKSMLVDLGVASDGRFKPEYSASHVGERIAMITGRHHIDYFVLSHLHTDHFGSGDSGITTLMAHSNFTFGTVIDTGSLGANWVNRKDGAKEYLARMPWLINKGKIARHQQPEFGTRQIDLGGEVKVDIVTFAGKTGPSDEGVHARYERTRPGFFRKNPASENDLSIGMEISLGDFEFWTGGDLSGADGKGQSARSSNYTNIEYPLVKAWRALSRESDVEIYRANHHGSRHSSGRDFLAMLDPEIILFSADEGHTHPSKPMVVRGATTAKMFATDIDPSWEKTEFDKLNGNVVGEIRIFVSKDGGSYELNGTPYSSFSDKEEADGNDSQGQR